MLWPKIFLHIIGLIICSSFEMGWRPSKSAVFGGSVARASAAKLSIMRLTQSTRTKEHDKQRHNVDCHLELEELANRIKDISSVLNSGENRAKVIVNQHNMTGVLGNFCPGDAHCKSYICSAQCGGIV
jgi:hypothetical protein